MSKNGDGRRRTRRGGTLTRRNVLGGMAATGLAFVATSPFIAKARAAASDLRLLMWQPYAIKETIQSFETKFKTRFSPTFFDGNSEAFNKMKVGGTKTSTWSRATVSGQGCTSTRA